MQKALRSSRLSCTQLIPRHHSCRGDVFITSPHPEAWKHTGASPVKRIINCITWKLNRPEVQMQKCVLWCFCMGKWVSMEEGRETRKCFEVQHTDWYHISCTAETRETGTNQIWHLLGGLILWEKIQTTPPTKYIFLCLRHTTLFTYHHFLFIFSCSSLQNTCKCIFYQSAEQLWAGCALSGEWGKLTVLSPSAIRSQVVNPGYFSPGLCLCFNNSMAHLWPLCWEHQ